VVVASDSKYALVGLARWLPARRAKGTAGELANLDLFECAEALLAEARRGARAVELLHVGAAHDRAEPADTRGRCLYRGNAAADALANAGVDLASGVRVDSALAPLAALARG
jgi:hypothetical protein